MAVNINVGTSRQEGQIPENFNETTEQNSEQDLSAQPQLYEQSGQSSSGQSTDGQTAPPPEPATLADQDSIPPPAYMRYGIGDTVIMGAPSYVRDYAQAPQLRAENASIESPSPAPTAPSSPAMFSIAMPSVSVGTIANVVNSIDDAATEPITPDGFAVSEPMTPLTTNTSAALIASTVTTSTEPIPMPKPGSSLSPTLTSVSITASADLQPITNAPRIGGEAVRQALAADQRQSALTGVGPAASAAELDAVDAMLADPINRQLIDLAKQSNGPADTKNWVAEAQIKLYGEARFQEMMYLHRALPMVQHAYASALTTAYLTHTTPQSYDERGNLVAGTTFDINAFNTEYASRSDVMAQAFAAKFGGVPVTLEAGEFGATSGDGAAAGVYVPIFNVGGLFSVSMQPVFPTGYSDGAPMSQQGPTYFPTLAPNTMQQYVLGSDIGDHRAMFDDSAVWFDPSLGFVTDPQNLKDDEDSHWDHLMGVVGPIVLTGIFVMTGNAALFGPGGAFASSVAGYPAGSVGYAAIQGGVGGAIGTVANSAVTGRPLTLADLGRSIFTGGVMGGLVNYMGLDTYGLDNSNPGLSVGSRQVIDWGERLTAIVGRGTMQGILQQVTGGRFRDGLVNGVASGLGAEVSRQLNIEINRWAAENNIPPFVASQLRMVGQGFASALARSVANGGQGGVEAFLNDLVNGEIGEAMAIERAEVNQLTTQYNEALRNNDVGTQAAVLNNLVDRWMSNHREDTREQALAHVTEGLGWTVDASRFARDGNGQLVAAGYSTPTVDRPTAVTRIAAAYQRNDPSLSQREAERLANDYIDRRGIPSVFVEIMIPDIVVTESRRLPFTTGSETVDRIIGAVGGAAMTGYNYVSGLLHGLVDITELSADGLLDIVNKLIGEDIFPDSAQRNTARADMFNNIIANLDQLPTQVAQYFNGRLERANQMDAAGDYIGAARERTELIGDLISMITNPRTPSAMRILERLGVDPAWFERTSQTQRAFRDAAIAQEHRVNPAFANADMTLFEAHHTIPIKQFPFLDELRTRLQNWSIDINAVDNAVMLPGSKAPAGMQGTYHASLSNAGYAQALERRFENVTTAAEARATLAAINNELRNGTFQFTRK
jgi:hypothetical protein